MDANPDQLPATLCAWRRDRKPYDDRINLGNILGPFSLNMAMISFVRDLEVSLVSPTAHVPQHWTPLGLVVTGAMDSVV